MKFLDFLNTLGTNQQQSLNEGIQDTHILKAVFLQGASSGSGKDFILDQILSDKGLVEIPTIKVGDYLFGRSKINFHNSEVQPKSRNATELREKLALLGRNGIIINGTADTLEKLTKIKQVLESLGYDCLMLLVNVSNEAAQKRNVERGQRGGRIVPETQRSKKWNLVQENRPKLAKLFGQNYLEFDNSLDLRNADPNTAIQKHQEIDQLHEQVQQFLDADPQSEIGKFWIQDQLMKPDDEPIPEEGTAKLPANDLPVTEQAKQLGLQYLGFGRYGKNRMVTHKSINNKLVEIPVNEAVSVAFTVDSPEELNSLFASLFPDNKKPVHSFSTLDAKTLLTLGKHPVVPESTKVDYNVVPQRTKLSLSEVRERQREKLLNESINDGESGMPLSGYSAEVIDKTTGKAKPKGNSRLNAIKETEETPVKNPGIDLSAFRAKNKM